MADEETDTAAPASSTGGGAKPKKQMIVVALVVANFAATSVVAVVALGLKSEIKGVAAKAEAAAKAQAKKGDEEASEEETPEEELPPGPVVKFDPVVVNLVEPGKPRYLKAIFELELEDAEAVKLLEEKKRLVRDEMFRYLSGLTIAQTAGEENKTKLQAEMKTRVGTILGGEERVRKVHFAEFVVQ